MSQAQNAPVSRTFVYCPVYSKEIIAVASDWNKGRVAKGKEPYTILGSIHEGVDKYIRRVTTGGLLRDVSKIDKLYILIHGQSTGEVIHHRSNDGQTRVEESGALKVTATRGDYGQHTNYKIVPRAHGAQKAYTAAKLASNIESEGLPKDFIDLRVFACGVASDGILNGERHLPFALRLKNILYKAGYAQIVVTGYSGNTTATYDKYLPPGTTDLGTGSPSVNSYSKGNKIPGDKYMSPAHLGKFTYTGPPA